MHLADQAQRQRQAVESLQAVEQRIDIVGDLAHVVDRRFGHVIDFEAEEIGQRRLRPLDLRREHGFLAHIHIEKQRMVRQEQGDAVQTADRAIGGTEAGQQRLEVERRDRRQGRRHEGAHPLAADGGLDIAAQPAGHDCLAMKACFINDWR